MTYAEKSNGLEMCWIPVVDATGLTHMEARWVLMEGAIDASAAHAITHAA